MPIARLGRMRETLPTWYRFGDGALSMAEWQSRANARAWADRIDAIILDALRTNLFDGPNQAGEHEV